MHYKQKNIPKFAGEIIQNESLEEQSYQKFFEKKLELALEKISSFS